MGKVKANAYRAEILLNGDPEGLIDLLYVAISKKKTAQETKAARRLAWRVERVLRKSTRPGTLGRRDKAFAKWLRAALQHGPLAASRFAPPPGAHHLPWVAP